MYLSRQLVNCAAELFLKGWGHSALQCADLHCWGTWYTPYTPQECTTCRSCALMCWKMPYFSKHLQVFSKSNASIAHFCAQNIAGRITFWTHQCVKPATYHQVSDTSKRLMRPSRLLSGRGTRVARPSARMKSLVLHDHNMVAYYPTVVDCCSPPLSPSVHSRMCI